MRDGLDDSVEGHQDEAFAERHLQAHMLLEARGHHPGAQEPDQAVGGRRRLAQELEDAEEVLHVLELLDGLAGEEARSLQIGSVVQPAAALDAGHFAVQELVHHPGEQPRVALGMKLRAAEIEGHLLAREQHGPKG